MSDARADAYARRLSAELERRTGRRVDSAQLLGERAALTGDQPHGTVSAGGACRMVACADGWLAVSLPRDSDVELLPAWLERDVTGLPADLRPHRAADLRDRARLLGLAVSVVAGERPPPLVLPPDGPAADVGRPLVVDFSALWAGPLCARLLGLAGGRVVKVETPGRPDGARLGNPAFYDLLHAGHESLVVDPADPAGRRTLEDLVDRADVVIEASRPRALAGWGLSADASAAHGTVWLSITAYGRTAGDRIGFGDDVAAGAGLIEDGDPPAFVGDAIADPLTGLTGAVAVLRALAARARTGSGQLIDLAMSSVVAATLDPAP